MTTPATTLRAASGRATAAGWSPALLPNVLAWYDARDPASMDVSAGNLVGAWRDVRPDAPAENTLVPKSVGDEPSWGPSWPGGRPAVRFEWGPTRTEGTPLVADLADVARPFSVVFAAVVYDDVTSHAAAVIGGASNAEPRVGTMGTTEYYGMAGNGQVVQAKVGPASYRWAVVAAVFDVGADSALYVNRGSAPVATGAAGTSALTSLVVGNRASGLPMNGSVGELLVVAGAVTDQLPLLFRYLAAWR